MVLFCLFFFTFFTFSWHCTAPACLEKAACSVSPPLFTELFLHGGGALHWSCCGVIKQKIKTGGRKKKMLLLQHWWETTVCDSMALPSGGTLRFSCLWCCGLRAALLASVMFAVTVMNALADSQCCISACAGTLAGDYRGKTHCLWIWVRSQNGSPFDAARKIVVYFVSNGWRVG